MRQQVNLTCCHVKGLKPIDLSNVQTTSRRGEKLKGIVMRTIYKENICPVSRLGKGDFKLHVKYLHLRIYLNIRGIGELESFYDSLSHNNLSRASANSRGLVT
jgi:hypothetical protein